MRYSIMICLLFIITSCHTPPPLTSVHGHAMTMDFHIQVEKPLSQTQTNLLKHIIYTTFEEVDAIYNKWNNHSEISRCNQSQTTHPIPISNALYQLLLRTDFIVQITEGRFDPTIEPIQQIWKAALKHGHLPNENIIDVLKPAIGWNKVHFTPTNFWKDHPDLQIDLGGIAKGYAVDLIFKRLHDAGFSYVYVEWGGEIRVSSLHPTNRAWQIAIKSVKGTSPQILGLSNQAIATSGDYEQYWELHKGEVLFTYFHIINPCTLTPLEMKSKRIASASCIANECWLADGLATAALFFESKEEADQWAAEIKKYDPEIVFYFEVR